MTQIATRTLPVAWRNAEEVEMVEVYRQATITLLPFAPLQSALGIVFFWMNGIITTADVMLTPLHSMFISL
jgi:hypothetical protein